MASAQEQARPQQQIVQNQDGDDQASKQAVIVLPSDLLPIVNPGELRFADIDWNGPPPVPIEGDAFAAPVDNQRAISQDKPKKLLKEEEFPPSRITAQCDPTFPNQVRCMEAIPGESPIGGGSEVCVGHNQIRCEH